jgi:hypothetical protein
MRDVAQLNDEERDLLLHALGLDRARISYRNHYSVSPKAETYPLCVRLAAKGLLERSATYTSTMIHFHVTDAGKALVMN